MIAIVKKKVLADLTVETIAQIETENAFMLRDGLNKNRKFATTKWEAPAINNLFIRIISPEPQYVNSAEKAIKDDLEFYEKRLQELENAIQ